jgi:hypothetical protein
MSIAFRELKLAAFFIFYLFPGSPTQENIDSHFGKKKAELEKGKI